MKSKTQNLHLGTLQLNQNTFKLEVSLKKNKTMIQTALRRKIGNIDSEFISN